MLSPQEINEAFINANLEENYNFLQEDLVKLSLAIIERAQEKIAAQEREECIKIARSLNHLVAEKIQEIRGKA